MFQQPPQGPQMDGFTGTNYTTSQLICCVWLSIHYYTTLHYTTLHYTMLQFLNHSCLLVHVDSFTVLRAWLIHSDYLSKRKLDVNK